MVKMIVEKEMYHAYELEQLLIESKWGGNGEMDKMEKGGGVE